VKAADVVHMSKAELAALLAGGHPLAPEALAGATYRGTSLGLPKLVEKLTWRTFRKAFHQEATGAVRGWNVRVEQAAPYTALSKAGEPWTFGHFEVVALRAGESPLPVAAGGALLDYGRGGNPALDPTSNVRDPVVSLVAGAADLLLGWTYVRALGRSFKTPSFFLLEREGPALHVARRPGA
jgi:hypothetical protein